MSISARNWPPDLDRLPGAELIHAGLVALAAGEQTEEALLIEIAAPRLAQGGLEFPPFPTPVLDAEIRLYRKLGERHGAAAYSQYNALLRRLGRFCHALDARYASASVVKSNCFLLACIQQDVGDSA